MKYVLCDGVPSLYSCNFTSAEQPTVQPGEVSASLLAIKCTREVLPTPIKHREVKEK